MNKTIVFPQKPRIITVTIILSFFLLLSTIPTSCKVVKLDKKEHSDNKNKIQIYFDDDSFNAAEIVESHWDNQLIPYYIKNAVDINLLLEEATDNPITTSEKYAYSETEENTTYNFIIKGEGIIVETNTESRAATIDIDLCPYDGKGDVSVQIGPVIRKTSVRDAYALLSYADFNTQLEWASIKNAINKLINSKVLENIDRESLINKKASFYGAFTLQTKTDFSEILITPVQLEISKGN